jgi:octaprenyl-diphosphate synthase
MLSIQHNEIALLSIVNNAVNEMSEGELLQMEKARHLDIDEAVYYEIIRQKTASLIASCCAVGATSVGADEATVARMKLFGQHIGMAFQIKDDLFDYGDDEIGKPVGIDIKEKKMTLPLIYALSKASWLERRRIAHIVRRESDKPKKVREVIEFVKKSGGIEYAQAAMERFYQQALEILKEFPESKYKTSLGQLVEYTINRAV